MRIKDTAALKVQPLLLSAILLLLALPPLSAQTAAHDGAAQTPEQDTAQPVAPPDAETGSPPPPPAVTASPAPAPAKAKTALVPFWGSDQGIISQFGEELRLCITKTGEYTPYVVDMKNLPPDVPEGGYPPYVCPSPSLTKDAAYALTGETSFDNSLGQWHLRLYLWQMADTRLVYSDELTAVDRAECAESLPSLIRWLFSWLPRDFVPSASLPVDPPPEPPGEDAEKLLYLGLRAGSSLRFYKRAAAAPFVENEVNHYFNFSAAFLACYQFFPSFGVQAEAVFTTDYAPFKVQDITSIPGSGGAKTVVLEHNPVNTQSLMFPLLLKYTYRRQRLFAAAFGGVYYILPIGETANGRLGGSFESALTLPLGYALGINLGMRAGPGLLFLDIRWAADLGDTVVKDTGALVYRRSMISLCLGYELGFFTARKR